MEFADCVLPDKTYYTEHGELRFYEKPKPKFAFFNAKAKKPELFCFSSTIRAIANCLPEAQAVARAYITDRKSQPETAEESVTDEAANVGSEGGSEEAATPEDKTDDLIFCKLVSQYGHEIQIKNNLQVNVFNDQPMIWLKPWWRKSDDPGNTWLPSNAGFQFSIFDSARNMVGFADRCLSDLKIALYGCEKGNYASKRPPRPTPALENDGPAIDGDKDLVAFAEWIQGRGVDKNALLETVLQNNPPPEIEAEATASKVGSLSAEKETGSRKRKRRSI